MTSTARERILARIRKAASTHLPGSSPPMEDQRVEIPREYRPRGEGSREEVLDLFVDRVSDYRATVLRATPETLSAEIGGVLVRIGPLRLVLPPDLPPLWLEKLPADGVELLKDGGDSGDGPLAKTRLASCDGVLTGCALAIAETGTIVLDAGPGQGRRALSLLPDHHICVVHQDQVVQTVPEAVAAMARGLEVHRRPLTLISGPSATSDIELIRVEGVHGPRKLEVILVEGD